MLVGLALGLAACATVPFDNFEGATYPDSEIAIIEKPRGNCCLTYIMLPEGEMSSRGPLIVYDHLRDTRAAGAPRNPLKLRPG